MNRNALILLAVIGMLWLVCELCPVWFSARLPQNCQRLLCPGAQVAHSDKFGFVPTIEHYFVVELGQLGSGWQLSFDPRKPTLKRIVFSSLFLSVVLLALPVSRRRWLRIVVRLIGVLALLISIALITLMIYLVSL